MFTGSTALQDAIDAAVDNDIIYVVPSSTNYGDVTITDKVLTIFGVGLQPDKDIGSRSLVDDLTINGAASSGCRISGLEFDRFILANTNLGYTLSNILLENSRLDVMIGPGFAANSLSNVIVRNNIFNGGNNTGEAQSLELFDISNFVISNNIIRGSCCVAGAIQGDGLTIQNNLFHYGGTGGAFHDIDNSIVQNNIFYGASPAVGNNQTGNSFINNLSFSTANDTFTDGVDGNTATGNIVAMDPLLTNVPLTTSFWNDSNDPTLMALSPALLAGQDGTDIGPSGGAIPFDLEGTLLPLVQTLNIPAVVTQGDDLNVNVRAKGN